MKTKVNVINEVQSSKLTSSDDLELGYYLTEYCGVEHVTLVFDSVDHGICAVSVTDPKHIWSAPFMLCVKRRIDAITLTI